MTAWIEDELQSTAASEKILYSFNDPRGATARTLNIHVDESARTFTCEGDISPSEAAIFTSNLNNFLAHPFETYRCDEKTAQFFAALAAIYDAASKNRLPEQTGET
jgi:hypothetical protein